MRLRFTTLASRSELLGKRARKFIYAKSQNLTVQQFSPMIIRKRLQDIPFRVLSISTLGILPLLAQEPPPNPEVPKPEQGQITESGKFEPAAKPGEADPAPDPAALITAKLAQLAEIGITADVDKIRIGGVDLDRKALTVTIQASVNMLEGATEYLLVHRNGKVHESIFTTDAKPQDIHIACLLAGMDPKQKPADIAMEVTWETNGPPRRHQAEELVAIATGSPQETSGGHLDKGPWHYTGSRMDAAGFAATREGSIIALITDPAALVANPRPSRTDDSLHTPNKTLLPPVGHPVQITIRRLAGEK